MKIQPKYLAPNGFTALSMLFGLSSIAASATGQYTLAAWMILWGVLLDKLDGTAARLFHATSEFGVQFDSFADFVVFGIAPAALVFFHAEAGTAWGGDARLLLLAGVGCFVVATSARLARFNISEPPAGDRIFYGIPTPLVGATLASFFLTSQSHAPQALEALPILLLVSGAAMVSNLRLPKLKRRKNKALDYFQMVNIAVVYIATPFRVLPEYLLVLCVLYLSVGLTWGFLHPPHTDHGAQPA